MDSDVLMNNATKELDDAGFFDLKDDSVGQSLRGLELVKFRNPEYIDVGITNVLRDEGIRAILKSILGKCVLVHWLRYTGYPGHIMLFRRGGPSAGRRAILVQLLSNDSEISYRYNSQMHDLPTTKGKRSLYETSEREYQEVGCHAHTLSFPQGGKVILDGRVGWEIKRGFVITFEFVTPDLVHNWHKMKFPKSYPAAKIQEMESEDIGLNFKHPDSSES